MRITRATTSIVGNPVKNWLFVRLDTDQDGLYRVGNCAHNGFAKIHEAAVHELVPRTCIPGRHIDQGRVHRV